VIKNFWGGDRSRPDTFSIPDLRGYFLRGVDGPDLRRDPDADLRRASNPGGPLGRQVGTVQGYATHLPVSPFTISVDGGHQHGLIRLPTRGILAVLQWVRDVLGIMITGWAEGI
jgi:hypothetical protein